MRKEPCHFRHFALKPIGMDGNWDELYERLARCGVNPRDVTESYTRSGGPGGQNVNKVETAVRLAHAPSGLAVLATEHRSREMNRRAAWLRLVEKFETIKKNRKLHRDATRSKKRAQSGRRPPGVKRKMVENKRHRGETKKLRARVST